MFSYHLVKRMVVTTGRYPDMVVGVSAGAIIGALLVTGLLTTVPEHDLEQAIRAVFGTRSAPSPLFHTVSSGSITKTGTPFWFVAAGEREGSAGSGSKQPGASTVQFGPEWVRESP